MTRGSNSAEEGEWAKKVRGRAKNVSRSQTLGTCALCGAFHVESLL